MQSPLLFATVYEDAFVPGARPGTISTMTGDPRSRVNPTAAATASRADAASLSRKGQAVIATTRRPKTARSRQSPISEARTERLPDLYQDISYHYR